MNTSLAAFRERLNAGVDPNLKGDLEQAVVARRGERGQHRDWARLCEDAGLLSLAFSELQLAVRDDPQDPVAAFHLAQHYRERGDSGRASGLLARLLEIDPAHELWLSMYVDILREDNAEPRVEVALQRAIQHGLPAAQAETIRRTRRRSEDEPTPETPPRNQPALTATDADCFRFHTLFSGREGVYARQWVKSSGEGGYPHPVLHLLTLPARATTPVSPAVQPTSLTMLAQRYGLLERRRVEIQREWEQLRVTLVAAMTDVPDRVIACEGGRYRLVEREGVEELLWEAE